MDNLSRLLIVAVLATGCSKSMETRMQEKFPDRSPTYREGYGAGCSFGQAEAAHSQAKEAKDINRIQSDSSYANGWYDGFESCKDNYRSSSEDVRHDPTKPVRVEGGW